MTWSYDPARQLRSEARSGANAYRHTFTYDGAGNRTQLNENGSVTTSAYDPANRLRFSSTLTGRTTYAYDANGNQRVQITPILDRTTYVWTTQNQMRAVQQPTGDCVTYTWSPVTKLAEERQVLRDDGTDTTRFVWDNQNVVREVSNGSTIEADYTYQPQAHGELISQRRDNVTSLYHFDALGSEIALTQGGVVSDEDRYKAFGQSASSSGTTTNPYGWVGRLGYRKDEQTGLWNLHERDLTIGRFLSEDPIGLASGDSNFYRYVGNNPGNVVDPSGLGTLKAKGNTRGLSSDQVIQRIRRILEDGSHLLKSQAQLEGNLAAERAKWWPDSRRVLQFSSQLDRTRAEYLALMIAYNNEWDGLDVYGHQRILPDPDGRQGGEIVEGGRGFDAAVKAYDRSQMPDIASGGGLRNTNIEFYVAVIVVTGPKLVKMTCEVLNECLRPDTRPEQVHIDIGGEGRHADAWNVNSGMFGNEPVTSGPTQAGGAGHAGRAIPNLIKASGENLPFDSKSVDIVTLQSTPINSEIASEIARVIKPGGDIRLMGPNTPEVLDAHKMVATKAGGKIIFQKIVKDAVFTNIIVPCR